MYYKKRNFVCPTLVKEIMNLYFNLINLIIILKNAEVMIKKNKVNKVGDE